MGEWGTVPVSRSGAYLLWMLAWVCTAAGCFGVLYCLPHREFATVPHLLGSGGLLFLTVPLMTWSERLRGIRR